MAEDETKKRIYGPILPNMYNEYATKEKLSDYFGPILPPHLNRKDSPPETTHKIDSDQEEISDIVGPLPPSTKIMNNQQLELEQRALEIRIKEIDKLNSTNSKDEKSREEWMTELPNLQKSGLGIFARQFRKREGPDMSDRSIWTNTPNTIKPAIENDEKKLSEKTKFDHEKDKEQEVLIKKHKKKHKRDKSLMEIHAKKLKKEKKKNKDKEKKNIERRPFNREEDLQVNKFDQARKQAVIKKAQLLDSRFNTGKSKYL